MGSLLLLGVGGRGIAAAGAPLDGISGVTAAWSVSRQLLSSYASALYAETAGEATDINDQTGNTRHLNGQAAAPLSTAGPNSRACVACNGTDESYRWNSAISNLITNSAGYIIMSVLIDAITTNGGTIYQNDAVFADGSSFIGYHLKNGGGSTYTGHGYNWDGNADATTNTSFPVGSVAVVEWRHDTGNVLSRVNMGSWQTAASGNTATMTGNFFVLRGPNIVAYTQGKFFEGATLNVVPDDATRNLIAANFMTWIGA